MVYNIIQSGLSTNLEENLLDHVFFDCDQSIYTSIINFNSVSACKNKKTLACNMFLINHIQGQIVLAGNLYHVTHINFQQFFGKVCYIFVIMRHIHIDWNV